MTGLSAYSVVASKIAPTLSRKSTTYARVVYGLKNDWRDCRADQSITAALSSQLIEA